MAGILIKELKIRGLIKRTLIITPANLTFQWQRELKDKFREKFDIVRGEVLRTNYGSNPWQEKNQVITSMTWVSVIEDANLSLLRSRWDLIIIDEAHKMSARSEEHQTLAYKLGKQLSEKTDHYLLMTATPHKGDHKNFRMFLELLDKDVYGNIESLNLAIQKKEAPFYLRRVKEALISFPDPDTGKSKSLFTKRLVRTIDFEISEKEYELYDALTRFVEEQSYKAAQDNTVRGRAVGFIMAMLKRRFASSIYAVRRSLERMKEKREKILADPEGYKKSQIEAKLPEDIDDLTDDERQKIIDAIEGQVIEVDPQVLKEEIIQIGKLIDMAKEIELLEVETKLVRLKEVMTKEGIFKDPKMKLLIFTEHKDTLDYLVKKLQDDWKLSVTQIHGGMKIGDRDAEGTRLFAEREFREACQILVATEAAGEGINLQFCWFMINYDIPWNPVRLEQRMGRIHRYLQEKDCLILNFVSTNTREGRVMQKLFERIKKIENDLDPQHTGKIFNVLGEIFPSNSLERMIRDMYSRNLTEDVIRDRIVDEIDTEKFEKITNSTLEGLAKRELNLSVIIGKNEEAKERRLVPEIVEDFFKNAAPLVGVKPKEIGAGSHIYKVGKIPRHLWVFGDKLEPRFGKLGHEYQEIVFDKKILSKDPILEWVTPGHPLFESVKDRLIDEVRHDLHKGAIFYDINKVKPARLDVFSASIKDGRNHTLHKKLFITETDLESNTTIKQPTIFLDFSLAPKDIKVPIDVNLPSQERLEQLLNKEALQPFLKEIEKQRNKEITTIENHLEVSLNEIINGENIKFAELQNQKDEGSTEYGLDGRISQTFERIEELNERLERRKKELSQERECMVSDIEHIAFAWVLPHPERDTPQISHMIRNEETERIAVQAVIAHEEKNGWQVESVEKDNRGFDLISRKPHPEDPKTFIEVKFIEVKGNKGREGTIGLTTNEYKTAERLKKDYWLYYVINCGSIPEIQAISDPVNTFGWKPIVTIEQYMLSSREMSIYSLK